MNYSTTEFGKIEEKMHTYIHKSGLKVFLIPKRGYQKKFAAFATRYGSIDNEFFLPGHREAKRVPDGIAHFLEHKLFEQEGGSAMERFSELGASPNAYTGFNQTVYLFSATDRFADSLGLLLEFVQNPHITGESVEREKGIIGQEIGMYQDNPGWRVFFNLLNAMYKTNPVRIEIAGTRESIAKIDRETLIECYRAFYHPSNMIMTVCGDVSPNDVFSIVEKGISKTSPQGEIKRVFPHREEKTVCRYTEQSLSVSTPIFQLGFMDPESPADGLELIKREAAVKILLDMILGRASELYNDLYNEGLINSTFDMDYTIERNYAFSIMGGESGHPVKVRDRIARYLRTLGSKGLNKIDFERSRGAMTGRFIRQFNSVEKISHAFISVYFKGVYLFDYFDVYDRIDFGYAKDVFYSHFDLDKLVLSVIKPVQGG